MRILRRLRWRNIIAVAVVIAAVAVGLWQREAISKQVVRVRVLLPAKLGELGEWVQRARSGGESEELLIPSPTPIVTPLAAPGYTSSGFSWFTTPVPTPTVTITTHITHVVQPGETLASIAKQYGVTVEAIVEANDLADPDVIEVGQGLTIPLN